MMEFYLPKKEHRVLILKAVLKHFFVRHSDFREVIRLFLALQGPFHSQCAQVYVSYFGQGKKCSIFEPGMLNNY
jgi:hypothetical protein